MKRLLDIMTQLRDPKNGCPWDCEQDFSSIAPYTIEEAYEVVDAIHRGDRADLKDELGDLLLQVVFHSQMAKEEGSFDFEDVVGAICDKMVRRHPHVFGDADIESADVMVQAWEKIKQQERHAKGVIENSALDDVSKGLPPLLRAVKLTKKAAKQGFDWPDMRGVMDKLHEEVAELEEAYEQNDMKHMAEELGDLMFVCTNIARKLKQSPEQLLIEANLKFERRFRDMEAASDAEGRAFDSLTLEEQESLWMRAKEKELA